MKKNQVLPICSLFSVLYSPSAIGSNPCLSYKSIPSLEIKDQNHSISVVPAKEYIGLYHGTASMDFSEEYEIEYGVGRPQRNDSSKSSQSGHGGGWCVFVEKITARIGYSNFEIGIDPRHKSRSCEWYAVKEHEEEHILANLSVISDGKNEIKKALRSAAAAVMPVYAEDDDQINAAMDELESNLQSQPQIHLMREKLIAEQEIRNKKIDQNDRGDRLRRCE